MKHSRTDPGATVYPELTPEVRDAEWVAETRPDYVPTPWQPPDDTPGRDMFPTIAVTYLIGKVTAWKATGGRDALEAYLSATALTDTCGLVDLLEAAAGGSADAERQFLDATAGSRSSRNLRQYRDYHDVVSDAAAILRYEPPGP